MSARDRATTGLAHFARLSKGQGVLIFGVFLILLLVANILAPGFLGLVHLSDVFEQASILGIVALGQTLVLILGDGGIDLSVGTVMTLTSIVLSGIVAGQSAHLLPGIAVALGMGLAIGLINGLGVALARIPPLIMTLAMSSVIEGAYLVYTNGFAPGSTPSGFNQLWTGRFLGLLSGSTVIWLALAVILGLLLRYTRYGHNLYLIGGNAATARSSGVPTRRTVVLTFALTGLLSAVAGLSMTGYIGVPSTTTGASYTLTSIAAAVLGGSTFEGGVGTLLGSIGGALVMIVLGSILTDLNIAQSGRLVLEGAVLAGVVLFYRWNAVRPARRQRG